MRFEWDPIKAEGNVSKHKVDFKEASTIFGDPLSITSTDPDHSQEESRFVTVGVSTNFRTLVVVHADRGETVRIISARLATKREREYYEQEI